MCYQIYCIGYRISDEIKRQKENEKPYWHGHLHPEVIEKPIEEIEKQILDAGVSPEKMKEMTRHEKFLAVSSGYYAIDKKNYDAAQAELESLKASSAANEPSDLPDTSFLDKPTGEKTGEGLNDGGAAAPANDGNKGGVPKPVQSLNSSLELTDEDLAPASSRISDEELNEEGVKNSPFNKGVKDVGTASQLSGPNKAQIKMHAKTIVKNTISQINAKADNLSNSISQYPEEDLLNAVIQELNATTSTHK